MWIFAHFLHNLWKKIINCVVYLYNWISWKAQNWKTLYKVFYSNIKEGFFKANKKSQVIYLRVYNYRVYIMMKDTQLKKNWKWKLNSYVYINYLINYNFMNIFRVWISYKDEIIFIQDIIFNECIFLIISQNFYSYR